MLDNYKNSGDIIEFLKKEFKIYCESVESPEKNKEYCNKKKAVRGKPLRFENAISKTEKHELQKVLEVKLGDYSGKVKAISEDFDDIDDIQSDAWQKLLNEQKIEFLKKKNFFSKNNFLNFAFPLTNVPGIVSYCREKEKEANTLHLSVQYASLALAVLMISILIVVALPEASRKFSKFTLKAFAIEGEGVKEKNTIQPVDKILLSDFIKNNNDKIEVDLASGEAEYEISEKDLNEAKDNTIEKDSVKEEKNDSLGKKLKDNLNNLAERQGEFFNEIAVSINKYLDKTK